LKKETRETYPSWVIFPQCSENDRWPSLLADRWDETFKNNISNPNKSLGLVIRFMDQFIEKKQVDKQKNLCKWFVYGRYGDF
jgi:hypothetical protein